MRCPLQWRRGSKAGGDSGARRHRRRRLGDGRRATSERGQRSQLPAWLGPDRSAGAEMRRGKARHRMASLNSRPPLGGSSAFRSCNRQEQHDSAEGPAALSGPPRRTEPFGNGQSEVALREVLRVRLAERPWPASRRLTERSRLARPIHSCHRNKKRVDRRTRQLFEDTCCH